MADNIIANELPSNPHRDSWGRVTKIAGTGVQALLFFLAIGVIAQNIILQKQNQRLKTLQAAVLPKDAYLQSVTPKIDTGRHLQSFRGLTIDGKVRDIQLISQQQHGTVIITFSPGCVTCVNNQKGWAVLATELKSQGWQVFWVSRDSEGVTGRYCSSHNIDPGNVIADPTYRTYEQLALASVPNTVVIDSQGVVKQVWRGRLGESWAAIFGYFQLHVPESLVGAPTTQTP